MLDAYLHACINNATAGRKFSIDEITIGFQGHHARLKMRCGKFKRAGDGFQVQSLAPSRGASFVARIGIILFLIRRKPQIFSVTLFCYTLFRYIL